MFTTRIDTIYGANFLLLAPEHPLVQQWARTGADQHFRDSLKKFQAQDRTARMTGEVEKEGFATGREAINPFTKKPVPIWVANFVLIEYGTGAVMGVPGHDQRDFEFARKYGLPVTVVVQPEGERLSGDTLGEPYDGPGTIVNSGEFDGLSTDAGARTHVGVRREARDRRTDRAVQAEGLGNLPPEILGDADPCRLLRHARHGARPAG